MTIKVGTFLNFVPAFQKKLLEVTIICPILVDATYRWYWDMEWLLWNRFCPSENCTESLESIAVRHARVDNLYYIWQHFITGSSRRRSQCHPLIYMRACTEAYTEKIKVHVQLFLAMINWEKFVHMHSYAYAHYKPQNSWWQWKVVSFSTAGLHNTARKIQAGVGLSVHAMVPMASLEALPAYQHFQHLPTNFLLKSR